MYVDKNSIIVDGVNWGQYLVEASFGYNKLWGSDTGRNLAGEQTGTLIGIFPKLELQFRKMNQNEVHTIAQALDKATQSTTYHDDYKGTNVTMSTYAGDWKATCKDLGKVEGFPVSLIARKRRE